MNKYSLTIITLLVCVLATITACNNGETYADMKDKERDAINSFISSNKFVGYINEISEEQFEAQGETTDTAKHEFVCFESDGIYMQIVRKGTGQTMIEMAKEQPDSTISKVIICRFFEWSIENGDTTCTNLHNPDVADKMLCTYTHRGKSYSANFTEGYMRSVYSTSTSVPNGWLKPLNYIRLAKSAGSGEIAKVRLIVPHSSGTLNASNYVLPHYYEITYQLGK